MTKAIGIIITALLVSFCQTVRSETWYVAPPPLGRDSNPGTEDQPFATIQKGIDAAKDGDTVIVAQGTYVENIQFNGKNIILRSTDPLNPDVVANTIIDGNQTGPAVTFANTENETCVLSGFTIRNGTGSRGAGVSGGNYGARTQATLRNNVITGNSGGGVVFFDGLIENNVLTGNTNGGLSYCDGVVRNNVVVRNAGTGGLWSCGGMVVNNTIADNSGAGLTYCDGSIHSCIVWGNLGEGGVQIDGGSIPTFSSIQNWTGGGEGNIAAFPYLVNPLKGDYHLATCSPCIDSGYPASAYQNEPQPNGGRINMGAYGNTSEATSRSPDTDRDGLPDDWEKHFFSNLFQGPNDDPDNDLKVNADEYRRGANPARLVMRHVDASVPSSGDGTSWQSAFKTIQEGINAASEWDTILVAEGTYVENINFKGKNITLASTDPLNSAVVEKTIIDGNEAGSVLTFSGSEDETCVLTGFTIRNGMAVYGGGICGGAEYIHTHATIQNNVITGNSASLPGEDDGSAGGGLCFCDGIIQNNTISGNSASATEEFWESAGGGLAYCDGIIRNNSITSNSASASDEFADNQGGGLAYCNGAIRSNIIAENSAPGEDGGGGGLAYCAATVQNNTIRGNSAAYGGGLGFCRGAIIESNIIRGNQGMWGGGLGWCQGRIIQNNTVVANSAEDYGGGLAGCAGIHNCIIWGNTSARGGQIYDIDGLIPPSHSCIQDWTGGGEGNISENPLFVNEASGDYRLKSTSPCRDKGLDYYWFAWPQRDADGNCRVFGDRVDMGCYEYGASPDSDGDLLSDADEPTQGTDAFSDDSDGDGLRDGLEVLRGTNPKAKTPPQVIHVPADMPSIQQALCLALDGDEIVVSPGDYSVNLQFCGANVILRSSDPDDPSVVDSTVLDGGGSSSVVRLMGTETESCVVSGFTIKNGFALSGGGIYAGAWPNRARAAIRNNVITENFGESGGGIAGCDGLIDGNTIAGNNAYDGGGLCDCNGVFQSNTISGNSAGEVGRGGGLLSCWATIQNNVISGNSAFLGGGLQLCEDVIRNNLIVANSGGWKGGGLYMCEGTIENNTIVGNSAGFAGGLLDCTPKIVNCILWGNTATDFPQFYGAWYMTYCCVQDWDGGGGEGNTNEDPGFVDADGPDDDPSTYQDNDYRLRADSPCVDKGMNADWMLQVPDLDRNPRVFYGKAAHTVDMGPYELGSWPFSIIKVSEAGGNVHLKWNSRPGDTYVIWSCVDLPAGAWTEVETVGSQGSETIWTGPAATGETKFHRVELK